MKVLLKSLEVRLRQLPPLTVTTIALCCVVVLGVADFFTLGPFNTRVFYVLPVALAGWGAGKRHAWFVSAVTAIAMFLVYSVLHQGYPHSGWEALWNNSTRFLIFCSIGWLVAELATLTRRLEQEVEERTAQWKAEAQGHQTTAIRLAEANERFEQVINNIAEVFWLSDVAKDQVFYISPAYERIWGRQCEALYREPRSWLAAVHPADRDGVARRAQADQASGSYDIEYRIIRPDGAMRWVRDRAFPVRNAQGEVCRIAGLADDITERRNTRETLQMQASILENMAEGVVVTDDQGLIVLMNPGAERIWGYARNEALGKPTSIFSALPEPEATRGLREVLATLEAAGEWRGTFKNRRKDGAIIACDAVIRRVEIQGRVLMVAVEQDVTERLRTQEQLEMQARVLENMAEAVLLVDENGTIKLTNPPLDALLGYGPGALLGQPLAAVVAHPTEQYRRKFEEDLQQVKTHGSVAGQTTIRRGDDTLVEVEYRTSGLTLESEFFLVIVGQDITQRHREGLIKEVFLSLGSQLSTVTTPVEAARAVYAAADKLWKWDCATLAVYSPASDRMEPVLFCDVVEGRREEIAAPLPAGLPSARMRRVMQQGAELILRRPDDPPPADAYMFGDTTRVSASVMCVPLRRENQRVGMLSIQSYTPNAYTKEDLQTLQALADYCGGALERIQAEVALRQSEELNRTIVATAMDGFHAVDVAADPLGAITDTNDAYCSLTGYSREELLQMRIADVEAMESPEETVRHLESIVASHEDRFETRLRRKDGREIDVEISASHLPGSNQRLFGFVRDITARKRADRTREAFLLLGTKLNEAESPLAAARAVCTAADRLWQWDAAVLQLYSVERDCMDSVLLMDLVNGERREVPAPYPDTPPPPAMRRIMESGPELILRTPAEIQSSEFVAFGDVQRRSASLMYAPLRREGRAVGVLSIQSYAFNAYTPEDLRTLQTLADRCGGALERIRAEEALREAHDKLELRVRERTRELEMANAALGESESRLRLALDASNAGTWSGDVTSSRMTWDDRCHEQHGFGADRPRSLAEWLERVHPDDREHLRARIRALVGPGGGDVWNLEYRVLHPVRGERWIASMGRMEHDHGGQPLRIRGISLDVTERKRAEEAQRAQLAYIETIYQNTPIGLCVLDLDFRYVRINERLAAINGLPVDQHLGQKVRDAVPDLADGTEAICRQVFATGQPVLNFEIEGITAAQPGVTRTWISSWVPLKEADGRVSGVSVLIEEVTERKRLDQALRDSEAKYRRLHETMTDAFVSVGLDGGITESNRAYQDMVGYTPEELSRLAYVDITPDKWHAFEAQLVAEQVMTRGYSDVYEKEYRRKDGTVFPIELRTIVQRDQSGQPVGMWAIVRDITERKQAAQALQEAHDQLEQRVRERTADLQAANAALRESEQRYHSLVDNLSVGVYRNTPGPEGRFLQANPALARMLGYGSVEESQKVKVADTYQNPRDRATFLAQVESEGTVRNCELRLKKKDGTPIYASVNATAHRGPDGNVDWLDGVIQDITDTKRAQEALRASEERYRTLAETSPDAIFIIDRDTRVAYVNSAAAALWNRQPDQIIGRSQEEIFPPETARRQSQVIAEILAGGGTVRRDVKVPFPGGERWLETRLVAMMDERGAVHSVMGVSRDITERKRAETGLQAERDLAEALSLTRDIKAALKSLLEIAIGVSGLDSGAVYLLNEAAGGMDLTAHRGGSPGFVQAVSCWPPDSPQMRLVLQGRPVFGLYRDLPIRHDKPRRSEGLRATAFIPLCHEQKPIAALVLSSSLADELPKPTQALLNTIATQAVGAIARIRAEGERHKLEGQLLEITDREQARIGQDLHDGLCQQLVSLAFDANSLQRELTAERRPEARIARRLSAFLDESITEARALSRGLFPVRLEREGLPSALEELARTTRRRYKVRCSLRVRGTVVVKHGTVATHLYRIAQEAVTNAIKHAQPGAISISLAAQAGQIQLKVEDDGTGIRPEPIKAGTGMGLNIMNYRARSIGGTLRLTRRPRGGTIVLCCVPQQME